MGTFRNFCRTNSDRHRYNFSEVDGVPITGKPKSYYTFKSV